MAERAGLPRFSAADAALSVFGAARAHPRAVGKIYATYAAIAAIVSLPVLALILSDLRGGVLPWAAEAAYRPSAALRGLAGLLLFPVAVAVQAAFLRLMLRAESAGWRLGSMRGGLRFGLIELKLLAIAFLGGVLAALAAMAAAIVSLAAVAFSAALTASSGAPGAGALLAAFALPVAIVLTLAAALVLMIRFSPAPAMTVRFGGFRFFEAWRATRGLFWPLLGAHLLALALYLALYLSLIAIFAVSGLIAMAPVLGYLGGVVLAGAEVFPIPPYAAAAGGALLVPLFLAFAALSVLGTGLQAGISAYVAARLPEPAPPPALDFPPPGADLHRYERHL